MSGKPRRLKYPHLLGSKWTAVETVMGWRHFQVRNRQDRRGGVVFAELQSVCDPTVRFWINARGLKNQQLWRCDKSPLARSGWLSLEESDPCLLSDPEEGRGKG